MPVVFSLLSDVLLWGPYWSWGDCPSQELLIPRGCKPLDAHPSCEEQSTQILYPCYLVAQSSPTLCDPRECSPAGSSVHGILQAWILEWVTLPFSVRSSRPRGQIHLSCGSYVVGRFFTTEPPGEPIKVYSLFTLFHLNVVSWLENSLKQSKTFRDGSEV